MARIAGVDIPRNKQVRISLQYIYGIGPTLSQKILAQADVNAEVKTDDLTEGEVNRLREIIDQEHKVEGELRKDINSNIKRLMEIGSYRGMRHRHNLPVRGQNTRTNARTQRGSRKTVAGRGKRRLPRLSGQYLRRSRRRQDAQRFLHHHSAHRYLEHHRRLFQRHRAPLRPELYQKYSGWRSIC